MENKKIKLCISFFVMIFFLFLGSNISKAASATISASSREVSVGTKVTITVSGSAKAWSLKVNGSGISDNIVGGNLSSKSNQSFSETYTLNTSVPGTYTVSLTGDVTDANSEFKDINTSVIVKVSDKKVDTTNNNNNNNNNSNNNNNNPTSTKPEQPKEKEPIFKSVNEKMYATGSINVRKSYSADSDRLGSLQTGDEVTRTGIGDNGWSKVTFNGGTGYIKSNLLTTEQPKKSEDKTLKSLTIEEIEGIELTPAFNPEVTEYSVIVGKDVEKLNVKAEANDKKSKVEITNVEKIEDGDNLIKIVVTAEDGTARTYTINVKKQEEKVIGLTSLKIQGYTINPKFSTDVYEYKLTILDPKVTSLEIITDTNDENAKVEVTGNTNIKPGENTILIKVTSEDGNDTITYKIIVNKTAAVAGTTSGQNNNMSLYCGIGIIGVLVIAIITILIIAKRKSKYEEDYEEDYEDDLYGYSTSSEPSVATENESIINTQNENVEEDLLAKISSKSTDDVYSSISDSDFNYNSYTSENLYQGLNNNNQKSVIGKFSVSPNENHDYPGKKFNYDGTNFGYSFDNINSNNNGNYFSGTSNFDNYYSGNTNNGISNDNFYSNDETSLLNKSEDWNYDGDNKPRKSRGKHSR